MKGKKQVKRNMKMGVKVKKVASQSDSQHQETEGIICGEIFDEDWIQCKNVRAGLTKYVQI